MAVGGKKQERIAKEKQFLSQLKHRTRVMIGSRL